MNEVIPIVMDERFIDERQYISIVKLDREARQIYLRLLIKKN